MVNNKKEREKIKIKKKETDGKWRKKEKGNSRELFALFNFYSYNIFAINQDYIVTQLL